MENQYRILQVMYDIVRDDPQPLQRHVVVRELLLRLKGNWQSEYLEALVREKLVIVTRSFAVTVQLTEQGWEKARRVFA